MRQELTSKESLLEEKERELHKNTKEFQNEAKMIAEKYMKKKQVAEELKQKLKEAIQA